MPRTTNFKRLRTRQPEPAEVMQPADLSESVPPARVKKLSAPEKVLRAISKNRDKRSRFNDVPSQPVE